MELNHKLLHDQIAYVGEEQKFTTGIDRISESETYPNSLTVDFSKYPVYVSHSIRLVVRTLEHDIIASKYVGVDDTLLKIENPIKFNNINKGIDLQNKTILLDVESICDYEGEVSCCDQMPSSLFIRDSINTLELINDPSEAVTTTTTTTTVQPPLPPTDPQRIIAPFTRWAVEPTPRFKSIGGSFTNYLYYDADNYNDFYNALFNTPVGGIFTPNYLFTQYFTISPSQPDPITGSFTPWLDKEVNPSNFEIQFWDSQSDTWSSTERYTTFYFAGLDRFNGYDADNNVIYCEDANTTCPYYLLSWRGNASNFVRQNRFNVFDYASQTFKYYYDISPSPNLFRRTFTIFRRSPFSNREDMAQVARIATRHTIQYRSRVIINNVPSEWAVNTTSVTIIGYEVISKQVT